MNIQMYSIKEALNVDYLKTLDEVARIGYSGVQLSGNYGNMEIKELKKELDKRNLKVVGAHIGYDLLLDNLQEQIEIVKALDSSDIVCPYTGLEDEKTALEVAQKLNKVGEICYNNQITLSYHNHKHELAIDNGKYALDIFFENTDPKFVKAELDVYWVRMADVDPYSYVMKYQDRMRLIHLKQFNDYKNVDADDGIIDFKKIMGIAKGVVPIYEQEGLTAEDAIARIEKSYNNCLKYL